MTKLNSKAQGLFGFKNIIAFEVLSLNVTMVRKSQPYNLVLCVLQMTPNKFRVIWPHRLQDFNALVLKKDVEKFLETHLEVKFDF